ncbi:valyl-tRNA synthetase [Ramicandelaber brevisporus]|nr:valyl-tRNA synthetase [Ramicandelaber brevisporus]
MTNEEQQQQQQQQAASETPSPSPSPEISASASTEEGSAEPSKSALKKLAKQQKAEQLKQMKAAAKAATSSTSASPAPEGEKVSARKQKKAAAAAAAETTEEQLPETVPGEMKNMSAPMANAYNPKHVEAAWYDWWVKEGLFEPKLDETTSTPIGGPGKQFVIAAPPPNITGSLHMGHALAVSLEDAMIRWNRMHGRTALFAVGMDHASISTQNVVEKMLLKKEGVKREELGREKFLERVWEWKAKYGNRITTQFRRLGASYDWSREAFTMDENLTAAVKEAFTRLADEGLVTRDTRLVNWCCHLGTGISDLEVDDVELAGPTMRSVPGYGPKEQFEFGVIVHFKYQLEDDENEFIEVATTRIETMLGDVAVAVHPDDERYTKLHGRYCKHPFIEGRRIKIITDSILVDPAFGTGAVKITPAHDPNDYETGKRHGLQLINILNKDGTMNKSTGPYAGMKRFHVRKQIIEDLTAKGLYVKTESNPMIIPTCSKSGDVIEPYMIPQWYIDCKAMAEAACKAVEDGDLEIVPKMSEKEWFLWLRNIQPWCVSRQLWWGHRVPAYLVTVDGVRGDSANGNDWVIARSEEEALQRAQARHPGKTISLEQDPDALDTWFSSGLWPFAIFGWPRETPDMANFYPNQVLETGWDILFFWVARMVMLGIKLTGQVPFKRVYCHAMIRDAYGRKMSKSLGNVLDPIDVIEGATLDSLFQQLLEGNLDDREVKKAKEGQKKDYPKGIPECGTDALRFALCTFPTAARSINLEVFRIEGYRKFCNKIWNATKFALMKLGADFIPRSRSHPTLTGNESLADKWILHRLNAAVDATNKSIENMEFSDATTAIYNFWLYELCDVYIEYIKPLDRPVPADATEAQVAEYETRRRSAMDTLYTCLEGGLLLLAPFMPYLTEELWHRIPQRPITEPGAKPIRSISLAPFPTYDRSLENTDVERQFAKLFAAVQAIRSSCASYNIVTGAQVFFRCKDVASFSLISEQADGIAALIKGCRSVQAISPSADSQWSPKGCALTSASEEFDTFLLVQGVVDVSAEIKKLQSKVELAKKQRDDVIAKTEIAGYETKFNEDTRKQHADKIAAFNAEMDALAKSIENFAKLDNESA